MLKWIRKQLQQEEGLTLIELIVVVAIIAILAFTITPRVLDSLDNSRLNGARSVANELHSGLERYFANIGTTAAPEYPLMAAAGAGGTAAFQRLRDQLTATVGLTNTTTNVIAGTAAAPTFEYVQYRAGTDADEYTSVNDGTDNSTVVISYYCITFTARDRSATRFRITPRGIVETPTNNACPTGADSALTAFN